MLSLEVKMIARNKRPRTTAMMSILFIFYGLLIYKDYDAEMPEFIFVLGGMFMTGVFWYDVWPVFSGMAQPVLPLFDGAECKNETSPSIGFLFDGRYKYCFLFTFVGVYGYFA